MLTKHPDARPSNIASALAEFQTKVGSIEAKTRAQYGMFADLPTVLSVINPVLSECGLSLVQGFEVGDNNSTNLTVTILHVSGESIVSKAPLVTGGGPSRSNPLHLWGGAVTYMRRYMILSMLNLASGIEDNDGATHSGEPNRVKAKSALPRSDTIAETKLETVLKLIDDAKSKTQLNIAAKAAKGLSESDREEAREAYMIRLQDIDEAVANRKKFRVVLDTLAAPGLHDDAVNFFGTLGIEIRSNEDVYRISDEHLEDFKQWLAQRQPV